MFNTLHVVETGLNTARRAASTSTTNIANENVKGYVKRTTDIQEVGQDDARLTGRGALIGETIRNTSDFLYKNFVNETTKLSYQQEMSTLLNNVEMIFKETDESGFSKDMDAFFQSLENLKSNPQNITFQEDLKNRAAIVVDDLQTLYSNLENEELALESQLKTDVRNINRILGDIQNINEHIGKSTVPQLTLLDKRDTLEKDLAAIVNISVSKDFGDYELKIGGVTALRNENIREFHHEKQSIPQADRYAVIDSGTGNNISSFSGMMDTVNDKLVYEINKDVKVEVAYGEVIAGLADPVDETNIVRAMALKINNDPELSKLVTAYNGNYSVDEQGNKIPNPDTTADRFLVIESKEAGKEGEFFGDLKYFQENTNNLYEITHLNKSQYQSVEASSSSVIKTDDQELQVSSGSLKVKLDNLTTGSSNNVIEQFKNALDTFAATLSDMSHSYIQNSDGSFIYGQKAVESSGELYNNQNSIDLFSGSSVKTMKFNQYAVNTLEQKDYDYLNSFSFKDDILFNNKGQENASKNYDALSSDGTIGTTFSKFFQSIHIDAATYKAKSDFGFETQQTVTQSIENTFNKMVKVDPDEEMINLMKFQSAYEANAKIATILQDMIATTLSMVNR
jgi:flagellar hook-associated protein 1 FlgK